MRLRKKVRFEAIDKTIGSAQCSVNLKDKRKKIYIYILPAITGWERIENKGRAIEGRRKKRERNQRGKGRARINFQDPFGLENLTSL